ncbi:MAG: hypothetical protein IPK81_02920 [Rhodospirillales bacterium]|nr:MAG: hypothetical protein IPK81_02920 [Rhodospirillales bacterium]
MAGKLDGKEFADFYSKDGVVKSMIDSQIVSGKWTLEGEKICFKYPDEDKDCYAMEVVGSTATFTDSKGTGIRAEILPGNAKNL